MHGPSTLSEPLKCWDPLDVRDVTPGVSQQCAGVVVPGLDEPVAGLHEVLVVSVVKHVAASHSPHVFVEGVAGGHPAWAPGEGRKYCDSGVVCILAI